MSHPPVLDAPPAGKPIANAGQWYRDWQHQSHRRVFDVRAPLDARNLIRNFEAYNDVRLLRERIARDRTLRLRELGCATGEFYRYLRVRHPNVAYDGLDVSEPAVACAKEKYPDAACFVVDPAVPLAESVSRLGLAARPEIVYAKDVLQHQVRPLDFLAAAIEHAAEAVVLRCRTRDVGATEWDPERSCQYHYDGWMPYIVINLQELIGAMQAQAPAGEIVVYRHHMVLGGRHNRFVPRELYERRAGTAETAIGLLKQTTRPGTVTIQDRLDAQPRYTWDYALKHAAREAWRAMTIARASC